MLDNDFNNHLPTNQKMTKGKLMKTECKRDFVLFIKQQEGESNSD
jgi:hypothetical protein